jgi:hypothetical protein
MMKRIKIILFSSLVLVGASCKKFLEEHPTSFLQPTSDFGTLKAARAMANAPYAQLQGTLSGQNSSYGGNTWDLMEFMTGKSNSDLGQTGFVNYQTLTYNSTSFYFDTWWQRMYLGIGDANLAIQTIPTIKAIGLSDSTKTNMVAEARTLRALFYFYLVRMYGDVPNVTTVPTDIGTLKVKRSPAKNIYDSIIIPDLQYAANSSLPWHDNTGLVSKGAVNAILADVYLTYAGQPINGGANYYSLSAAASKAVIDNGGYSLFPEYTDMINPANKNKGEFILQVQYSAAANVNNPLTPLTIPNYSKISKYSDEYGSVFPTDQFLASYPAGDKRTQERQFYYGSYPNIDGTATVNFPHHYIYKWFDSTAVRNTAKSDLNYTLYRLADVYLMYAEASNETGGPSGVAVGYVNAIRARANLAPISTGISQDDFRHEIWLQRYYELAFENKMWFDMLRTRKVHNDVTGNWDEFVGHKTVWGATFTTNQLLFPVPKQETDVNPNLLPNNPGF